MKIPQIKPDWNTGIYIGNGVVAKPKVKSITMDELTELQNSYMDAKKKNQTWIMQAMEKVFEDIDLGKIRIKGL